MAGAVRKTGRRRKSRSRKGKVGNPDQGDDGARGGVPRQVPFFEGLSQEALKLYNFTSFHIQVHQFSPLEVTLQIYLVVSLSLTGTAVCPAGTEA